MNVILCCLVLLVVPGQEQVDGQSLPDVAFLWEKVKPNLIERYFESEALKGYTYRRSALIEELGRGDVVKKTARVESEIYHFDNGLFRKLISQNGVPLSEKEIKKQDQEFARFKTKGSKQGSWRPWGNKKTPKELEERLTDLRNAFDFTVLRREVRFDRPTIVVDFKPRKNPNLKTMAAKLLFTKVEGTAWIDEQDFQLAKVEMRHVKDMRIAFGVLATLGDESETAREWTKVNNEIWLPLRSKTRVKGRAWFFLDGFNVNVVEEFSDYKKFTVDTTIKVIGGDRGQ